MKKKIKNPLIKRIPRELLGDWKKYLVVALFLILTIVVPLCYPILLFCCRKKELGMPPRRPVLPEDGQ